MDALHIKLRMVIREAWKNLAGQQAFKGVVIDHEMRSWGIEEFSFENQIQNKMACGTSATRLCEILAGTPLSDIMTSLDAVSLADEKALGTMLAEMRESAGYLVVRINVIGGGSGHSYVFLSNLRRKGDDLLGCIYQTNVGCHVNNAFGLNDWIADERSLKEIDLAQHLGAIATRLCGLGDSKSLDPNAFYEESYILSGRKMEQGDTSELDKMAKQEGTRAKARVIWAPVGVEAAMKRLGTILDAKIFGKVKA